MENLKKELEAVKRLIEMSDVEMLALTLDVIAYKLGGLTLTQKDATDFIESGKEIKMDMDEHGSLIYTIVDMED